MEEAVVGGAGYTGRLDRIENKLDSVVETLNALARVEERQFAANKRMDRFELRLDVYEKDLDTHAQKLVGQSHSVKLAERVLWALFAAALSIASVYLTK